MTKSVPVEINGLRLFIDKDLLKTGILAAFTTRVGGCSRPPFHELNLGFHPSDKPETVIVNRRKVARALGIDPETLVFADQVHGSGVAVANRNRCGAGVDDAVGAVSKTDAFLVSEPEVSPVILTADCVPIILVDVGARLLAVVHAGWRGTLDRVAAKAASSMIQAGADPIRIQARIGPAIGECCYEVGLDIYRKFAGAFHLSPSATDKPHLDLAKLNREILLKAGVRSENIESINLCTRCHPELFYSWRRDGETGRQAAVGAIFD